MKVAIHEDISTLQGFAHHLFDRIALAKESWAGRDPLSIEIVAGERTPVISNYNPIRVEHGDNLENEPFSQKSCRLSITHQIVQESLNYPASVSFSRMDPPSQNDSRPPRDIFRIGEEISNYQHITLVSSQSSTQRSTSNPVFHLWWRQFCNVSLAVWKGVRVAVRKVNFIIVILKI